MSINFVCGDIGPGSAVAVGHGASVGSVGAGAKVVVGHGSRIGNGPRSPAASSGMHVNIGDVAAGTRMAMGHGATVGEPPKTTTPYRWTGTSSHLSTDPVKGFHATAPVALGNGAKAYGDGSGGSSGPPGPSGAGGFVRISADGTIRANLSNVNAPLAVGHGAKVYM